MGAGNLFKHTFIGIEVKQTPAATQLEVRAGGDNEVGSHSRNGKDGASILLVDVEVPLHQLTSLHLCMCLCQEVLRTQFRGMAGQLAHRAALDIHPHTRQFALQLRLQVYTVKDVVGEQAVEYAAKIRLWVWHSDVELAEHPITITLKDNQTTNVADTIYVNDLAFTAGSLFRAPHRVLSAALILQYGSIVIGARSNCYALAGHDSRGVCRCFCFWNPILVLFSDHGICILRAWHLSH